MATILNRDLFQLSPPHTSTRGPADAARRRNRLHTIDDVRVLSPGPGASVPVSGNQQPRLHLLMIQPPSPETGTRLYLLGHTIPPFHTRQLRGEPGRFSRHGSNPELYYSLYSTKTNLDVATSSLLNDVRATLQLRSLDRDSDISQPRIQSVRGLKWSLTPPTALLLPLRGPPYSWTPGSTDTCLDSPLLASSWLWQQAWSPAALAVRSRGRASSFSGMS
jgi:hypothetical protein